MTVPTYTVSIHMAGDIEAAKNVIRRRCYNYGLCVTVTAALFIYTGGEESGFTVGLVNYPRFPATPDEIWQKATQLVAELLPACNQRSALIVAPDKTEWITIDPPGAE